MLASWMEPLPDFGADGGMSASVSRGKAFSSMDLRAGSGVLVHWEATFELAEPMVCGREWWGRHWVRIRSFMYIHVIFGARTQLGSLGRK